MVSTAVHLELLDHCVAQGTLGQHALDGLFQSTAGELGLHVAEVGGSDAAGETRVAVVHLVQVLGAGDLELGGVDDDDEVAGVNVRDRKSTRLNSSHQIISYAVFCLKKKKKNMYSI